MSAPVTRSRANSATSEGKAAAAAAKTAKKAEPVKKSTGKRKKEETAEDEPYSDKPNFPALSAKDAAVRTTRL